MPFQRKNEYVMVNRRGTSTNTAYMSNAGTTNSQPMMVSRRTTLLIEIHRENAEAAGRLSDVTVEVTVDLVGAGITYPLLLSKFSLVLGLDGLQESGSVLFAADHLLKLRCPALGEDRAGRVR